LANPKNEGLMPVGLGRLEKQTVYIKTGDLTFKDKFYGVFVSGVLTN
jgi:hypothetical protein